MNRFGRDRLTIGAWASALLIGLGLLTACAGTDAGTDGTPDPAALALAERASVLFEPLPVLVPNPANPMSVAKTNLGRMLYYDARLSKNHDISCNSCHQLDAFGVDGEATSPGHRGARGDRNSPTVYNAALHIAQFWDGRAPDVEAQAKGPVLNPIEMAAPSEEYVVRTLASMPGYRAAFAAAFPGEAEPLTYDNMANAIGAFERELMTPGRFDLFIEGNATALDETERRGLATFIAVGCNSCHMGPALGGQLYRKLGQIFPYETEDLGRENVTGEPADRYVFKVPSLRNIAKTGPYFHDGSIATLEEAVRIMAYHQLGQTLDGNQIADIVAFLGSLTGNVNQGYVAKPELPVSGPDTPAPDPS
jgi:cytochrome c peroxidase